MEWSRLAALILLCTRGMPAASCQLPAASCDNYTVVNSRAMRLNQRVYGSLSLSAVFLASFSQKRGAHEFAYLAPREVSARSGVEAGSSAVSADELFVLVSLCSR